MKNENICAYSHFRPIRPRKPGGVNNSDHDCSHSAFFCCFEFIIFTFVYSCIFQQHEMSEMNFDQPLENYYHSDCFCF